jgi:hypothetical protein
MGYPYLGEADPGGLGLAPKKNWWNIDFFIFE